MHVLAGKSEHMDVVFATLFVEGGREGERGRERGREGEGGREVDK